MKRLIFLLVAFGIFISLCGCNSKKLSEEETIAYENCLTMKSMLKDPDSFKLYDKMFILKYSDSIGENVYTIFDYGGTNSYGAMIKDTAVFDGTDYFMKYDELMNGDESTLTNTERRAQAIFIEYKWLGEDSNSKVIEIDIDKIKNELGLNK